MIITPSAPIDSASRLLRTTSSVHSAPVPISTGTRPAACLTTISTICRRSSGVTLKNSPVLPSGIRPWMPSSIWKSTRRRSAASSTFFPSEVKGVIRTVYVPRNFFIETPAGHWPTLCQHCKPFAMRLKHPGMRPTGPPVRLRFDGREIEALPGETIAAALAAADIVAVRQARSGAPRGPFCGMGVCFDCLVTVDGRPSQRACLTKVEAGMDVRSAPLVTPRQPELVAPAEQIACDVLVVGAGPAGLSAARSLALAGADVIVADERLHAGGQYFKPLAASQAAELSGLDRQFRDGAVLHQSAVSAGVRILNETTVWAAFSPTEVAAIVAGRSTLFRPKRLVLATGAYEQAMHVPGWTLPGVMTVGGLQTLARSYRVAPGQRIVIAGNGPLCLQTAAELREGGANVVAVLESAARPGLSLLPTLARAAWADPLLLWQGLSLAAGLRGILHWRRSVTRLLGDDRVRSVEAADLSIEADIVALGYGFASSSELARSLGCAHRFVVRGNGSMETLTDQDGRTSIAEVFAIGDGARFGGAAIARAQGVIAAAAVARDLGLQSIDTATVQGSLRRAERFQG